MNDKNIASHVSAAVAVALAILAALHPGFKLPDNMDASGISLAIAGVIETVNTFFHRSNASKLAIIKALAEKAVDDLYDKENPAAAAKTLADAT
jgi:uncharacterized membrane protein HdeD (DUF308 family)